MPLALVEPLKAPLPDPAAVVPNVSDNIWSEPLPPKPRPFRIRLDDGTLVPLDQPVYLGRRPSVPRIHPGGVPLLVTLDSPQRELSSTHLELTTVGGAVVASDLKSANGSVVRIPGSAPHTLVGGESTVVLPGTIIELGDGNSIEVLPPDPEQRDEHVGS
jgi:pSer/pThr/pTyr-binding forkhead associated (FHA) protein